MIERSALEAGVKDNDFLEGRRERKYISICTRRSIDKIYGNLVLFNKNHLTCRVRIIGYIRVTLNPVKIKTPSLDMKLNKSSIMGRVCFALLSFILYLYCVTPG